MVTGMRQGTRSWRVALRGGLPMQRRRDARGVLLTGWLSQLSRGGPPSQRQVYHASVFADLTALARLRICPAIPQKRQYMRQWVIVRIGFRRHFFLAIRFRLISN